MEIMVEKIPHNGHIVLSARIGDELIKQVYIGYETLAEAKKMFRKHLKRRTNENL